MQPVVTSRSNPPSVLAPKTTSTSTIRRGFLTLKNWSTRCSRTRGLRHWAIVWDSVESPKHGLVRYIYPSFVKVGVRFDGTEKVWPCFRLRPFEPPVIPMEGVYSVYFLDKTGMQTKGTGVANGIRLAPSGTLPISRTAIERKSETETSARKQAAQSLSLRSIDHFDRWPIAPQEWFPIST